MLTTKQMRGTRVLRGRKKARKVGKIAATVFHPVEPRVVGFIVQRPDALAMVKRDDLFLAFDALVFDDEGRVCPDDRADAWDDAACKRMGIDFDLCVIWEGMPLRTSSGKELGCVDTVAFDQETGEVDYLTSTEGALASALLGRTTIPVALIGSYVDGAIEVDDKAAGIGPDGGAAAKAGAATARAKQASKGLAKKATKKTLEAVGESKRAWGGMISETVEAFKEASADDSDGSRTCGERDDKCDRAGGKPNTKSTDHAPAVRRSTDDDGEIARKLGRQLGRASGMFSAFKNEFEKEANGK